MDVMEELSVIRECPRGDTAEVSAAMESADIAGENHSRSTLARRRRQQSERG